MTLTLSQGELVGSPEETVVVIRGQDDRID